MGTLVLGAGLAGVATAHYLAAAGEAVTVVDRRPAAAMETSFANGGMVTPSHSMPWAGPKTLRLLAKSLGRGGGPVKLARLDPKALGWGLRFLGNCTSRRAAANGRRMIGLAAYSLELFEELVASEPGLAFDYGGDAGVLHLYRDEATRRGGETLHRLLAELGVPSRALARDEIAAVEPALEPVAGKFVGGLHAPADRSGDAHKFARALAERLERRGVHFRYGAAVERLEAAGERVDAAVLAGGERLAAARVVVALGSYAPALLRPLGVRLPVYPVKGHAVTYRIDGANRAPTLGLMDEARKMTVARLGDRMRVVGMADIAGFDAAPDPARVRALKAEAAELFREVAEAGGEPEAWAGLRPMTPDGPPVLGRTKYGNLFLNVGHGSLGWTMACGSGRIVADLVLGRKPDHDLDGLTLERFA